jgi:hypothetical protein
VVRFFLTAIRATFVEAAPTTDPMATISLVMNDVLGADLTAHLRHRGHHVFRLRELRRAARVVADVRTDLVVVTPDRHTAAPDIVRILDQYSRVMIIEEGAPPRWLATAIVAALLRN